MSWVELIQTMGFPIACAIACAYFIFINVNRDRDESKEREYKLMSQLDKNADALDKMADSLKESNVVHKECAENNRMLMSELKTQINDIDMNVSILVDRIGHKEEE